MTDANTLRRLNWLWKWRHKHEEEVALKSDLLLLREVVETEADTEPGAGAYVHVVSDDAQTIAVAGEAIEWDRYHNLIPSFEFAALTFPATEVTVPVAGYYDLDVMVKWVSHTAGGSVWVTRTKPNLPEITVWPPAEDPGIWTATDGQRGSWFAPAIPCDPGDVLKVYIDHDAASTQDLDSVTLAVYLVEGYTGVHETTTCPTLQAAVSVSAADHDAFPGFVVADDGTHIILYREGTAHASTDGIIRIRTSADKGATWTSATTLYSDGSFDAREGILTKLSSGRIVAAIGIADGTSGQVQDGGVTMYSDDNGTTWSSAVQIDDGGFTDWSLLQGQLCELGNGDWLLGITGKDSGDDRKIRVISSDDAGTTWSNLGDALDESDITGTNIGESHMVRVGTTLYLFTRNNRVSGFGDEIYRQLSTDGGNTWGTAAKVLDGWGGSPRMYVRSNGDFVAVLRDSPNGTWPQDLVRSSDRGETWESCVELTSDYSAYGQCGEDANGKLGVAYSTENVGQTAATTYFRKES